MNEQLEKMLQDAIDEWVDQHSDLHEFVRLSAIQSTLLDLEQGISSRMQELTGNNTDRKDSE